MSCRFQDGNSTHQAYRKVYVVWFLENRLQLVALTFQCCCKSFLSESPDIILELLPRVRRRVKQYSVELLIINWEYCVLPLSSGIAPESGLTERLEALLANSFTCLRLYTCTHPETRKPHHNPGAQGFSELTPLISSPCALRPAPLMHRLCPLVLY